MSSWRFNKTLGNHHLRRLCRINRNILGPGQDWIQGPAGERLPWLNGWAAARAGSAKGASAKTRIRMRGWRESFKPANLHIEWCAI